MLKALALKAASSWLGYKIKKPMSNVMDALYRNDRPFYTRQKLL